MTADDLKQKAIEAGMRMMQSERARRLMANPRFQQAMMNAVTTANRVKAGIAEVRVQARKSLDTDARDDTAKMKRDLEQLDARTRG